MKLGHGPMNRLPTRCTVVGIRELDIRSSDHQFHTFRDRIPAAAFGDFGWAKESAVEARDKPFRAH
jgi:hypothetical protein